MSRGPGRIERAIRALFDAHADRAFGTDELCQHCRPDAGAIERKHEVAVVRAVWNVIGRDPDWRGIRSPDRRSWAFFNQASLESYAHAHRIIRVGSDSYKVPGGRYERHVRMHIAERDGDVQTWAVLEAEEAKYQAGLPQYFARTLADAKASIYRRSKRFDERARFAPNNICLALAAKARALMTQNDLDAVRAGLAEIADALEVAGGGDA